MVIQAGESGIINRSLEGSLIGSHLVSSGLAAAIHVDLAGGGITILRGHSGLHRAISAMVTLPGMPVAVMPVKSKEVPPLVVNTHSILAFSSSR